MIDRKSDCVLLHEMNEENLNYWFDYKGSKFLQNIDTFYYSVKLQENFCRSSEDRHVFAFREYFKSLDADEHDFCVFLDFGQDMQLNYVPFGFAGFYDIHLECPEYFDIFMASSVPSVVAGSEETVTSEIIVQIRSCLLWELGAVKAFEYSYQAVEAIVSYFHFTVVEVKENRVDYCWHTNYFANPEKYFRIDNLAEMMVTRLGRMKGETGTQVLTHNIVKAKSGTFEIDYVAIGKRSDKCFLRIYLKSKEVVQQGYKPWFFKIWLFNNLINRYDFYCYEETYKIGHWNYLDIARLKFYLEYGLEEHYKAEIRPLLDAMEPDYEKIRHLANLLTPPVHLVMNIEFQTMRRMSKSFVLQPLKDNSSKGVLARVYDYFDNRKLIMEYLTHECFRLIDPRTNLNRSLCDYNAFWKALRATKLVDVFIPPKELELYRDYSRKLNYEMVKTRVANGIVTASMYRNGMNDQHPLEDVLDFIVRLNDNDVQRMRRYKQRRKKQLNHTELAGKPVRYLPENCRYRILDTETGEFILTRPGDVYEAD